jgi:hypothetical protein
MHAPFTQTSSVHGLLSLSQGEPLAGVLWQTPFMHMSSVQGFSSVQ